MPAWQARAATAGHWALYVLMIAVPVVGWLMSSALGFKVVYLGVLPLPDLIGKDKALGETLKTVHQALAFGMIGVVAVHVLAAIEHQWIRRDRLMLRMMPSSGKETT